MVLCMMPQMAYAEEALLADNIILTGSGIESDPYLITSPEDLKSLEGQTVSGYYQLAKDVDMSGVSMSPIRSFSGTLDGNGNAIRNLNLSGGSKTALIGEFKGGTIKNLTLDQAIVNATSDYSGALIGYLSDSTMIESCTVVNSSITSSAGYVGGMIGQIYGSSTKVDVKYCAVKDTTVESTKTSSTYIGGLIGDISSAEVTVEGSYSSAQVKGAQYVGGLVGRTSGALFSFNNTYVTGTVISPYTSSYVYSGGFIGGASVSSSKPGSFENCYFGGAIQNSTDATGYTGVLYGCSSASSYQYPSLSNCYYDMDKNFEETKYEITGKTTSEMKDPAFAAMLGGAYEAAAGDYPILKWQNPNAIYSATFHVEPIDAIVTLDGTQQSPTADGVYTMTGLVSGQSISYTVTQEEGAETDYKPVSGTLVIGKSDAVKTIKLLPNIYDLKFHLVPEDAEFQVTDAENYPLTPTETTSGDYTYHVANGTYYYQCSAFGYEEMSGEAVVDHGESINNVTLKEKSKDTVTFQLMAEGKEADLKDFSIQVSCGDHFAETKNGTVQLYEGYTYDYIIRSKNYATVSGKLYKNPLPVSFLFALK